MISREELVEQMDIRHVLFGLFFSFSNVLQTVGDSFYEEITCKQFFLLICLSLFPDTPPTIGELAEATKSSHQNVKQLVNKLEKSGYIKVMPDEQDKRKLRIVQTDKMDELNKKYKESEKMFFGKFYEGITDADLKVTYEAITKMEQNLDILKEELK